MGPPTYNAWSFEGWFSFADITQTNVFLASAHTASSVPNTGWSLRWGRTTAYTFEGHIDNGTLDTLVGPTAAYARATWHHVVLTYDGTAGRIYVDGALAAGPVTGAFGGSGVPTFAIGNDSTGQSLSMSGSVDECAWYNAALPLADVQSHWNAGKPGPSMPALPIVGPADAFN